MAACPLPCFSFNTFSITVHPGCILHSYLDNASLINREDHFRNRKFDNARDFSASDHDIIMALSEVWSRIPLRVTTEWVASHQDNDREFYELSRPAQANVLADEQATAGLHLSHNHYPDAVPPHDSHPSVPCLYPTRWSIPD